MAKKHHKKRKRNLRAKDSHHLLYQGRHWQRGGAKALRNYEYCIIDIPRDTLHADIHEWVSDIPAPSEYIAWEVLDHLEELARRGAISEKDDIIKRLRILIALFECVAEPTVDALKKQLAIACKYYDEPS